MLRSTWHRARERGAVAALLAVLLGSSVVFGMAALVVDVGTLYAEREQLQTAADAAGWAVARDCLSGLCATSSGVAGEQSVATTYANLSRRSGSGQRTHVTAVCGQWGALPACPPPGSPTSISNCIGQPAPGDTYVEVRVSTLNAANGTYLLPPTFSATLTGSQGYPVHGCARYSVRSYQMPALWAGSTTAPTTLFINATITANGLLHSNNDILIQGHSILSGPIEYVSLATIAGGTTAPAPTKVAASTMPGVARMADYRPGGRLANAAGGSYYDMSSRCTNGTWTAKASEIPAGLVYVNCGINITRADAPVNASLVAEGDIAFNATGITVTASSGLPALISNATDAKAINETGGSSITIRGNVQALQGGVYMGTSGDDVTCGIYAGTTILINSNNNTVDSCLMATPTLRLSG